MARIVVLSRRSIIHPRGGGACRYVHEIFRRLTDSHSITILASGGGNLGSKPIQEIDGIDYRHFPESSHRVLLPARYLAKFAGKTDLLIDNSDVGIPWLTPLYARAPRITIVHQLVREIFYQELPRPISDIGFISEPLLYKLYSGSKIVAASQSTAQDLIDLGIPVDNIDVVSPGCTIPSGPRATLGERSPNTVACVTRLMRYKGVQLALMAIKRIVRDSPDARLVIAGAGPYQNELERIAQDFGISKNVEFLGRVSDESKIKLYSESRVMISPSQREGFGMSVIEANSVGTPVVGWDVPGLKDSIVHNETGLLAPFPNDQEFAEQVARLLNDDKTWERLSQNAWQWAGNHTWDQSANSFRKVIEATLAKAK
jgi:glycosyltransferase involved in cell wall biosynthesis